MNFSLFLNKECSLSLKEGLLSSLNRIQLWKLLQNKTANKLRRKIRGLRYLLSHQTLLAFSSSL